MAKMKSANMDTLIVLGTTTAYVFSLINTFPTPIWENIHYEASVMIIVFILLGKYLENKTKGKASSTIRKLLELQPKMTTVRKKGHEEEQVSVELLQSGDALIVDEIRGAYALVTAPDGQRGWVKRGFLVTSPTSNLLLDEEREKNASLIEEIEKLGNSKVIIDTYVGHQA